MPELIDRAKVLEYLTPRIKTQTPYGEGYNRALEDAAELVNLMPTIEPEVRHGEWTIARSYGEYDFWKCGNCKKWNDKPSKFCPRCGSRMDGGADK